MHVGYKVKAEQQSYYNIPQNCYRKGIQSRDPMYNCGNSNALIIEYINENNKMNNNEENL